MHDITFKIDHETTVESYTRTNLMQTQFLHVLIHTLSGFFLVKSKFKKTLNGKATNSDKIIYQVPRFK